HARDRARPRRQRAVRPRGSPLSPERRDGEVQWRARRGRRAHGPRRRPQARDRRGGAPDPEPRGGVGSLVLVEDKEPGVRFLSLNKPNRKNALGPLIIGEATRALEAAFAEPKVRVIVLTGAGDAFSVGADFQEMMGGGGSGGVPGDFVDLLLAM